MILTVEQLTELKDKILADKCLPIKAIRELYPNEDNADIRTQLFAVYPRNTLISDNSPVDTNHNIETIETIDNQLARLEARKQALLAKKASL